MNKELGLKLLSLIMDWDDDQARVEFSWLSFMAAYKYDGYGDYLAGARFIESLATWLQQFSVRDRTIAYNFVKKNLIYFNPPEIHRLVEKFFPEVVQEDLIRNVSSRLDIPKHRIWASTESIEEYRWERRKTLFMGLSDGARIDILRRMNVESISNDQIAIVTQIDHQKWKGLLNDLRSDLKEIRNKDTQAEKFSRVYLIDDFTASGTSLLRDPERNGNLKGKLEKFSNSLEKATKDLNGDSPFSDDFEIVVHHYIGTEQAKENFESLRLKYKKKLCDLGLIGVRLEFGMVLSSDLKITDSSEDPFVELCRKYYDDAIEGCGIHGGQSGIVGKMFGYANCGLPVVLEHNTPNNSLPLIWAETKSDNNNHNMRPLFRRRERYSDMDKEQQNKFER